MPACLRHVPALRGSGAEQPLRPNTYAERRRCRTVNTIAVMIKASTGTPIAKLTQATLTIPVSHRQLLM